MNQIQRGDVVAIVRECFTDIAPRLSALGAVFRVTRVYYKHNTKPCLFCGADHSGLYANSEAPFGPDAYGCAPIAWLKKFDPPADEIPQPRIREIAWRLDA